MPSGFQFLRLFYLIRLFTSSFSHFVHLLSFLLLGRNNLFNESMKKIALRNVFGALRHVLDLSTDLFRPLGSLKSFGEESNPAVPHVHLQSTKNSRASSICRTPIGLREMKMTSSAYARTASLIRSSDVRTNLPTLTECFCTACHNDFKHKLTRWSRSGHRFLTPAFPPIFLVRFLFC